MKNNTNLWLGGLLIIAGLFFLLNNTGFFPFEVTRIIFSWPMLLVAIGLILLIHRNYLSATVLLIVGTYFLIPRIYQVCGIDFPIEWQTFRNLLWAALFIFSGFAFIFGNRWHPRRWHKRQQANIRENPDGTLQISCMFGDIKHEVNEKPFKGASVSTEFGGTFLDLSKSELAEGDTHIQVSTIFGGTEIWVPASWHVMLKTKAIFGGAIDKNKGETNPQDQSKCLIIEGSVMFGGIEVKRV